MENFEIWHRVEIKCTPGALYQSLTSILKLSQWWTNDTRGKSEIGNTLEFWFDKNCSEFQVAALDENQLVRWQPTDRGLPDWVGTTIEFTITPNKDTTTTLDFKHTGWFETENCPLYSMSWATFLLSLQELLETGKGHPFPDNARW